MTTRTLLPTLLITALTAVPAVAFDGTDNPGTEHKEAGQLNREDARAIGRDECSEFKLNFKDNKQQFGQCVSAVAKSLRQAGVSAREACRATDLAHKPAEGEHRSDFSACVLAAKEANEAST